jgi:hypothetical protein
MKKLKFGIFYIILKLPTPKRTMKP